MIWMQWNQFRFGFFFFFFLLALNKTLSISDFTLDTIYVKLDPVWFNSIDFDIGHSVKYIREWVTFKSDPDSLWTHSHRRIFQIKSRAHIAKHMKLRYPRGTHNV